MPEYKTAELGKLLNQNQIKQLSKLAKKGEVSINQIKIILLQDDSRWKDILIPDYFAYVILNEFMKRGIKIG